MRSWNSSDTPGTGAGSSSSLFLEPWCCEVGWRRALVTGASSGIGEAFVELLASDGVDLVLVGRNVAALQAVAQRASARGVHVDTLVADLATEQDVARVVNVIRKADPMIDLLVNDAGIGQHGPFVDLPLDGALRVMRVNNTALVILTHAALLRMVAAGGGGVVLVSSTASASPGPHQAVYAASKAFVTSLGQAIADELGPTGVTCTTVLPGYTRTAYFERHGLKVDVPDSHWLEPVEVATAALDGARAGRKVVIPGAIYRRRIALATPFPSLAKGLAMQRLRQARRLALQLAPTRHAERRSPSSDR
jgi:uncharacterized protein